MPFRWSDTPQGLRLDLWPHRSLSRRGFVLFFGLTAGLMSLPLTAMLGSNVLWGLLPFVLLTLMGLWAAFGRTYRSATLSEELHLSPGITRLTRHEPDGRARHWQAHPHWVRVVAHNDGPVPHYLTLEGGPRPVEIGAFLTEAERRALEPALRAALHNVRAP